MPFDLNTLTQLPPKPGVYLMKGSGGEVLYVGKAKNLKNRVRQYFLPRGDGRMIIPYLIAKVEHIDTIVVTSEKEALLLENNLIKQHQPRYNALLKDDKAYVGLKINVQHPWPMLSMIRYKTLPKDRAAYFGPYTSAEATRQTLDLLHKIFPLRQCSDQEFARRTRPCILYDMKRCLAPCVGKCTKEEYAKLVQQTTQFLRGADRQVLKGLYREMEQASLALHFEKAGGLLKTIRQIESTIEEQNVDRIRGGKSIDVLAIFREGNELELTKLMFRGGKLMGSNDYHFANIAEEDSELFETFMQQHYAIHELPREILLPSLPENWATLADLLSEGKTAVHILSPKRGEKKALLDMAKANAEASFKKRGGVAASQEKILLEMQERFRLVNYPKKIECFDNSHIAGTSNVSSLVVFVDGVKSPSGYRKYKSRQDTGSDDYAAMREVLERRYRKGKEMEELPDLLIVDGGKGHLNIALKVLKDLDIISVDVISVAKEEGRHDRGITEEQVFLPEIKDPVILKRNSSLLFLLQQIRDEAHRTAISYHRLLHRKKNLRSSILDIPGIGPVKFKILLKHFGSLKGLLQATREDLSAVSGLTAANVQAILAFINVHSTDHKGFEAV